MLPTTYVQRLTGKPHTMLFQGADLASVVFEEKDDGTLTILRWDKTVTGMDAPSDADLNAALTEPEPLPVPDSVKDYQFAGQAASEGIIEADERTAWIRQGIVPQALLDRVNALPITDDLKERVIEFLEGATDYPRYHPNTITLGALFGKDTPAKLDDFFAAAGQR